MIREMALTKGATMFAMGVTTNYQEKILAITDLLQRPAENKHINQK